MRRTVSLLLILFVVVPVFAAEKVTLYGEKETLWSAARGLASAIDIQPLPAQGPLQHGVLVSAHSLSDFHDAIPLIKGAYDAGLPIVIVAPAPQSQSFLDDITGGTVDLPKGVAGVPRASLVILLGTLASFNLPVEGVIVIIGVDELMDMARTAVNVIGNCLATVVVARWENAFRGKEWIGEEAELEEVTGAPAIVS